MVRVFSILAKIRVKIFFSRIEFRLLIAPSFHPQNDFSYSCPCKKPIWSRDTSIHRLQEYICIMDRRDMKLFVKHIYSILYNPNKATTFFGDRGSVGWMYGVYDIRHTSSLHFLCHQRMLLPC